MITLSAVAGVALIELGMALTPGPNMVHLASRAITQGRRAGLVTLGGTAVGFLCHLPAAAAGLSARPRVMAVQRFTARGLLGVFALRTALSRTPAPA